MKERPVKMMFLMSIVLCPVVFGAVLPRSTNRIVKTCINITVHASEVRDVFVTSCRLNSVFVIGNMSSVRIHPLDQKNGQCEPKQIPITTRTTIPASPQIQTLNISKTGNGEPVEKTTRPGITTRTTTPASPEIQTLNISKEGNGEPVEKTTRPGITTRTTTPASPETQTLNLSKTEPVEKTTWPGITTRTKTPASPEIQTLNLSKTGNGEPVEKTTRPGITTRTSTPASPETQAPNLSKEGNGEPVEKTTWIGIIARTTTPDSPKTQTHDMMGDEKEDLTQDYLIWAIIVTICCKVSVVIIIRLSIKIRYTRMHDIPMQLTDIDSPAPTTPPPAAPSAPPATTPPTASAPEQKHHILLHLQP
eukprot:XP_019925045.1 PREDICTED: mucin-2-like isoform X2 [Crassostrea gigas]